MDKIETLRSIFTDKDARWRLDMARAALDVTRLPGPTGESNTLYLEPKGKIVIYCESDAFARQGRDAIVAALAAGNQVITNMDMSGFEADLVQVRHIPDEDLMEGVETQQFDGFVCLASEAVAAMIQKRLAARDGAIILPVKITDPDSPLDPHLIYDLCTEKVITINTAAIGGNAELLGLQG